MLIPLCIIDMNYKDISLTKWQFSSDIKLKHQIFTFDKLDQKTDDIFCQRRTELINQLGITALAQF